MNKEFYTVQFDAQVEEKQIPVDSTQLQLDSVKLFMWSLGYRRYAPNILNPKPTNGFIRRKNLGNDPRKFISFKDACRLHNECISLEFLDTPYTVISDKKIDRVYRSKLVERVKLQRLKKAPYVKVQSHWVKRVK